MGIQNYMAEVGQNARTASQEIARANTGQKNKALISCAQELESDKTNIMAANGLDLKRGKKNKLDAALLDRLELTDNRFNTMIEGLHQVVALPDPVGEITTMNYQPSGIQVGQMRVPLGVIGIIYESRPNVTVEAASLCLKAGNATILRGGSEAIDSNQAISGCISQGLAAANLSPNAVQVINTTDRAAVGEMITMPEYVDIIIPRGGKGLIERISKDATVPVIKHLHGVCHVYIDDEADLEKAKSVAFNSKTQRYGTCNTMESLLIAQSVASRVLPALADMYAKENVELRGCKETCLLISSAIVATEEDWNTEYLAPVLSIRIVKNIDEAISHISLYGSQHTDSIITENFSKARRFLTEVDSSSVMVNTSTRFADGFEYGLGAEIGISTDKIHARGPVGLEGLTSQKYIVLGDGHIRQ